MKKAIEYLASGERVQHKKDNRYGEVMAEGTRHALIKTEKGIERWARNKITRENLKKD